MFAVLLTVSLTSSLLVALTFHFWDCAITACTREIQAKSENALVQEEVNTPPETVCYIKFHFIHLPQADLCRTGLKLCQMEGE